MKTNNSLICIAIIIGISIIGCNKNDEVAVTLATDNSDFIQKDGLLVLGEKINDPYAINNINLNLRESPHQLMKLNLIKNI